MLSLIAASLFGRRLPYCCRLQYSAAQYSTTASPADAGKTLKFTLAAPHQTFFKDNTVRQVNISTEDGDVGILAGHLPMVLQLRPGVVQVIADAGAGQGGKGTNASNIPNKYFVSGGFATVNPDSTLQVAAMEAVPVDQLDKQRVEDGLKEAERLAANAKTDQDRVESAIHLQVYKAMLEAINKA